MIYLPKYMFEIMLGQQAKKENFMFTQRLRIFEPEAWEANDKYIDSLIALSKNNPGSVDDVWLTTMYGFPSLETHKKVAEYQKTIADKLRANGIRVSMQIANTIGHGSYMVSRDCSGLAYDGSPADVLVGPDGEESKLCFCWRGEFWRDYYKKVMEYYSVIKPDCVWIDDDLRARNHKPVEYGCFCDKCIAKFNDKYGYSFNREELVKAMNRTDIEVRRKWTEFVRDGLSEFTYIIVSEFVKHSPGTKFALQNGANGYYTGHGLDFLFDAMYKATSDNIGFRAGGSVNLGYRAGAGAYNDNEPSGFITKARSLEYQNSLVPEYVNDIRPEIECLPDVAYGKSVNGVAFETDLYFAYGATAMSYAMICRQYEPMLEYHSKEFAKFAQHRPYLKRLSDYNKRTKISGVEYMLSKNAYLRPQTDDEPDFSYVDRYSFVGGFDPRNAIPLSYKTGDKKKVYQLTERAVVALSDEDVRFLLTQPVFTDGKCLSMLMERGFDDFGVDVKAVPTVAVLEHFLPCKVNEKLWGTVWGQTYYDHNGYAFVPKRDDVMLVNEYRATNPSIEPFFPEREENKFGYSAVVVTTTGGGKWAIFGNNPWTSIISFDRRNQILEAIDYISDRSSVKAILADPLKAIVRPRITEEGKTACVSLVNATVGDSGELTLIIRDPETEQFDFQSGEALVEDLSFEIKNGEYYVKIPSMKGWSVATVFCK